MQIVHSPLHVRHSDGVELHRGELVPCYEKPERAEYIREALVDAGHAFVEPRNFAVETLHRVHDPAFVAFLSTAHARWREEGRDGSMLPSGFPARSLRRDRVPEGINGAMGYYAFDAGTPIVEGTWDAAFASAQCAMTAAALVAEGMPAAYALCRPPGHHAARGAYGGYCFLNNSALAAQELRDRGFGRVAVLDVDYHHGNGTQDIFQERGDVLTVSIHGTPETEYPYFLGFADERGSGEGEGCNLNLPLPRGTGWEAWSAALDTALEAVAAFRAEALVVPLGVDTYEGDPISAFGLREEHFPMIGARLAAAGLPTVLVQEGGYAVREIGTNVAGVLGAFERGAG
ncbi:histone deacetylase family protein [Luteimonas granuli]|uniref:Histone deacetylase family protein n=1 Tax=Luteimonas granuli TaxID=1176533 RepID=A0A518N6P9_9GAMM|nr:histone deacetylase family protein [Luteimonas granuli]QDW67604.1 histone deacetylase family protein [Luteimonas granuli]